MKYVNVRNEVKRASRGGFLVGNFLEALKKLWDGFLRMICRCWGWYDYWVIRLGVLFVNLLLSTQFYNGLRNCVQINIFLNFWTTYWLQIAKNYWIWLCCTPFNVKKCFLSSCVAFKSEIWIDSSLSIARELENRIL